MKVATVVEVGRLPVHLQQAKDAGLLQGRKEGGNTPSVLLKNMEVRAIALSSKTNQVIFITIHIRLPFSH